MGPQGIQGVQGPVGATGATGPAGPTLQKRTNFVFMNVPATGVSPVQLATLTFTPPVSGTAVVTGLGWCNVTGGAASTEIQIGIGSSLATAFSGVVQEWGILRLPGGVPATPDFAMAWEAQTSIPVTANTAATVVLAGRHALGALSDDCSGNLQVQVFTGALP
jgi:hypothetical protein